MELNDFVGMLVHGQSKDYIIENISGSCIEVRDIKQNEYGKYSYYTFEPNSVKLGYLKFDDPKLQKQFIKIYEAYNFSGDDAIDKYLNISK